MSDYNAADKFAQPADAIIIVSRAVDGVKANIQALADLLSAASARAAEAATRSANESDQNGAIGTLVGIEHDLESVLALYRAALALHRMGGRS